MPLCLLTTYAANIDVICVLSLFLITITSRAKYSYCSHFVDEEIEPPGCQVIQTRLLR